MRYLFNQKLVGSIKNLTIIPGMIDKNYNINDIFWPGMEKKNMLKEEGWFDKESY